MADGSSGSKGLSEKVVHLYVIRCKLGGVLKVGDFSHRAVLVKTETGKLFIIEYGVGLKSAVTHTLVAEGSASETIQKAKSFKVGSVSWAKQEKGVAVSGAWTVRSCIAKMEELNCKEPYSLVHHNCHLAQQSLRAAMGLKVDNPYEPSKYDDAAALAWEVTM
jgi:hypothetical protein